MCSPWLLGQRILFPALGRSPGHWRERPGGWWTPLWTTACGWCLLSLLVSVTGMDFCFWKHTGNCNQKGDRYPSWSPLSFQKAGSQCVVRGDLQAVSQFHHRIAHSKTIFFSSWMQPTKHKKWISHTRLLWARTRISPARESARVVCFSEEFSDWGKMPAEILSEVTIVSCRPKLLDWPQLAHQLTDLTQRASEWLGLAQLWGRAASASSVVTAHWSEAKDTRQWNEGTKAEIRDLTVLNLRIWKSFIRVERIVSNKCRETVPE